MRAIRAKRRRVPSDGCFPSTSRYTAQLRTYSLSWASSSCRSPSLNPCVTCSAQIARSLHLARQGVQRLADLLVREGLAAYENNPAHRRAKLLRITPQGRTALRTIQTAQTAWADTLGAKIGEAELRQASILLDQVLQAVGSHPPDAPPTDSA